MSRCARRLARFGANAGFALIAFSAAAQPSAEAPSGAVPGTAAVVAEPAMAAPKSPSFDIITMRHVDWLNGVRTTIPVSDAAWQTHELPLRWTSSDGERHGAWLRLRFKLSELPPVTYAMLLPRLPTGGMIYVNGHMTAELPLDNENTHIRWRRPHLIHLPPEFLKSGDNTILIYISFGIGVHGLAPVLVGPASELQAMYGSEFFVSHTLRWMSVLLTVLVAGAFAALWWRRRSEQLFGLLAVAASFWVLRSIDLTFEAIPAGARFWTRLAFYVGTGGFAAVSTLTMMRQAGQRHRGFESVVIGTAIAGPLLYLLGRDGFDMAFGSFWQAAMLYSLAVGVVLLIAHSVRSESWLLRGIVLALTIALGAAVYDYLVLIGAIPDTRPPMLNIATPILLFALAAALVDRFVGSLSSVEQTNAELETRIQERERLLKRNFDRLRESERVKAGAQERQRIMQDMHDGLGSQLLTSLMMVERGAISNEQVAELLRESIDDMRLAIDALAAEDADLLSALGNMRFRMEPRLKAAGIDLQWDARRLPEEIAINPEAVLPVLRIVQEAITNAVKHSQARVVRVTLAVDHDGDSQWLSTRVTDNGHGILAEESAGRGMGNMRSRAGRIGAFLKVDSVAGSGTMILLRYRLEPIEGPTTRALQLSLDTEAVIEQVKSM